MKRDKIKSSLRGFLIPIGLKKKFILTLAGIILFLGVIITAFVNNNQIKTLSEILQHEGITITKNLALNSETFLLTDDIVGLQRHINDLKKIEPDVSYIYILNPDRYVLVHTFEKGVPEKLVNVNQIPTGYQISSKLIDTEIGHIRDIGALIEGLGIVHVGVSEMSIRNEVKNTTATLLMMTVGVLIIGIILTSFMVAWELKPLDQLTKGAGEIGSGNLNYRIQVKTSDEIGILADKFNKMADDLKSSHDNLQKMNETLERRVEVRTLELKESDDKIRAITDSAKDAIIMMNSCAEINYWNDAAHSIFGYSASEVIGRNVYKFLLPEGFHKGYIKQFEDIRLTGHTENIGKTVEITALKKSGVECPLEVSISTVKLKNDWNTIWIARDISERKEAEHQTSKAYQNQIALDTLLQIGLEDLSLQEQLENSLGILFTLPWLKLIPKGAVFLVEDDPNTLILTAGRGLSDKLLTACHEVPFGKCLCGRAAITAKLLFASSVDDLHEISHNASSPHGHYIVPIISDGKVIGVINLYLKEGHKRDQGEALFLEAVANTLASLIKRKEIEKEKEKLWFQLLQAQKIESIGRMTGAMIHDFNNILTSIIGFSDLAYRRLPDDSPVRDIVKRIHKVGKKAANLINHLLAFSRKQVLEMKICNVNSIAESMREIFENILGEDIRLQIVKQDGIRNICADETQIEQILMNLVLNAKHAMAKGGGLTIKTMDFYVNEDFAKSYSDVIPGFYVILSIEDTGCGMTAEVQEKIFEPFFTTKEKGEGTGLGLSTVFGTLKQHNGFITVESEVNKGSKFSIYLPAAEGEIKRIRAKNKEDLAQGSETILIVEDDESIRSLLVNIVEPRGYKIYEAENGVKALELADSIDEKIDMLLTDVIMPGKNGWELYNDIILKRPDIKVIFISGFIDNPIILNNILEKNIPFIKKPLTPNDLLSKIRKILDMSKTS